MGNCIVTKSPADLGDITYYGNTVATGATTIINADQLDGHPSSYFLNTSSRLLTIDDIYPVGSIYLTAGSTSPAVLFGGTWIQISQGRTLIGAGIGTDANNVEQTFTSGSTGGEYLHTLIVDEIPAHTHTYYRSYAPGNDAGGDGVTYHRSESSNNSGSTGGGLAHNNIQPYLVVNIWQRTA